MTNATDQPDFYSPGGYGTGDLVFNESQNIAASQVYNAGTFYVGAAQALALKMFLFAGGPVQFSVLWNSQLAAQTVAGSFYTKSQFNTTDEVLPVLAPYVNFQVLNMSATTQATIALYAYVQNVMPGGGSFGAIGGGGTRVLAAVPLQNVNAGNIVTVVPVSNVPGPGVITIQANNTQVQATVRPVAGAYSGGFLGAAFTTVAGWGGSSQGIVLPNDDWSLQLSNDSGAAIDGVACVMSAR